MNYGYIGLGNLGAHLAMSLVKAGFSVTVNDLNKANAQDLLAAGAKWGETPEAVARRRRGVHLPALTEGLGGGAHRARTDCSPGCSKAAPGSRIRRSVATRRCGSPRLPPSTASRHWKHR